MVKILRFYSKTGGTDLISGQDTKTPYAVQHNRGKKKKKKNTELQSTFYRSTDSPGIEYGFPEDALASRSQQETTHCNHSQC